MATQILLNPHVNAGSETLSLFLFGQEGDIVTVRNGAGFSETVILNASGFAVLQFSNTLGMRGTGINDLGIQIISEADVSAIFSNRQRASTDLSTLFDSESLGRNYVIASTGQIFGSGFFEGGQFSVQATADDTDVVFTLPDGQTFTVNLDQGQSFKFAVNDVSGNAAFGVSVPQGFDLTGTLISATRDVAVFSGHACSQVGIGACDHLFEQMPSIDNLSTEYVVGEAFSPDGNGNNLVRVVAAFNNTVVSVNGSVVATINAGQSHNFTLSDNAALVETSNPALVAQYLQGATTAGEGDPAMGFVGGTETWLSSYFVANPGGTAALAENLLNIVIPTEALVSLELNGVAVDTSGFVTVPGTTLSVGNIEVPSGQLFVEADLPFQLMLFGFDSFDSYLTFGGATFATGIAQPNREFVFIQNAGFFNGIGEGDAGATDVTFTLQRTGPTDSVVTVDYDVLGAGFNPANAADFVGGVFPSGTATFGVGASTVDVTIQVQGDELVEANERFEFSLSNLINTGTDDVRIIGGSALATIVNDDVPPTLSLSGGSFLFEGNSGPTPFTFTLTRTGDVSQAMDVSYVVEANGLGNADLLAEPSDFVGGVAGLAGSATIAAGAFSTTFTVNVLGDTMIEPREDFTVNVTGIVGGEPGTTVVDGTERATILNDDGRPPVIPAGLEADVFGDPHITTVDGLGYDFQAAGEFILMETVAGQPDPFQVQVRFEPLAGSDLVSVTTAMAVEIGGRRVTLDLRAPTLLSVDGVPTDVSGGSIDITGDSVSDIFFDGAEYTLVLDGGDQLKVGVFDSFINVCVFLQGGRAGNVQGLMGNADGGTGNDLALRDGTVLAQPIDFADLYGVFADSWRLDRSDAASEKASLLNYPVGQNTEDFTNLAFPAAVLTLADLPTGLVALAEAAVDAAGITDPILRDAAILDFALTGDNDFINGVMALAADPEVELVQLNTPNPGVVVGATAQTDAVNEGDSGGTEVSFTVYRAGDTAFSSTIGYDVFGTFDADDLIGTPALNGSLNFLAGETVKTITLVVAGDLVNESDETIGIRITAPPGVNVAAAQATTTIVTDDFASNAIDDTFDVSVGALLMGNVFAANMGAVDFDLDGDLFSVVEVNGGAAGVGTAITLASGALLTLNTDGTFSYGQNGAFGDLGGVDTFEYTIADSNGGNDTALVTIGVNASDGRDEILGTEDRDLLRGTEADEVFRSLGGSYDRMFGGGGANAFVFGAEVANGVRERDAVFDFDADNDTIVLQGDADVSDIRTFSKGVVVYLTGDQDQIYLYGDFGVDDVTVLDESDMELAAAAPAANAFWVTDASGTEVMVQVGTLGADSLVGTSGGDLLIGDSMSGAELDSILSALGMA